MEDDLVFIPLQRRRWNLRAYRWLAPALAVLVPLVLLPGLWAGCVSLRRYDAFARYGDAAGLWNYYVQLTHTLFLRATLNTLYFNAIFVPGTLAVSLVLAVLLHRRPRGAFAIKTVLFASFVVSLTAGGVAWRTVYEPTSGLLNGVLGLAGWGPVDALHSPRLVLPAVAAMNIWRWFAPCTVILMAGLRRVPSEIYDLAATDGASRWKMIRHVTLPMLRRPGALCVVLLAVISLRSFEEIYVMTLDGGPSTWSTTLSFLLYRGGMERFELGSTMAAATMLTLIVGLCVFLLFAMGRRQFGSRSVV